ncbi:MAG: mercury resistance system periplasmic binding protein MerP [Rhodospirillaceae bacterium]
MKTINKLILLSVFLLAPVTGFAAEKTVTLAVEKMTCVTCPYIVKKSLTKVKGVRKVEVSFAEKKAVVTFDDSQTTVAALTNATTENGFPSKLVQ